MSSRPMPKCDILSQVEEVRVLGRGVHGQASLVTYRGRDACLKTGLRGPSQNFSFMQESLILEKLKGAGGAPRLLLAGNDWPLLLTDFRPFPTLMNMLENDAVQSQSQALKIFQSSAEKLHEVHQAGVVHCDFKVDNLLVDSGPDTSRVFLIDFGLAATIGSYGHFKNKDLAKRHPDSHYAPELYAGTPPRPSSDTYSLGMMMRVVLALLQDKGVMATVDPLVSDLVNRMTELLPAFRPSLPEVASLLRQRLCVLSPASVKIGEGRDGKTGEGRDGKTGEGSDGKRRAESLEDEEGEEEGPRKRQKTGRTQEREAAINDLTTIIFEGDL